MARKSRVNGRKVEVIDAYEAMARAKYLRARAINGSEYVVTDFGMYPGRGGSAGLRAAADEALVTELESSIVEPVKP